MVPLEGCSSARGPSFETSASRAPQDKGSGVLEAIAKDDREAIDQKTASMTKCAALGDLNILPDDVRA